jgi:IrrE N-terminal-like domain
VGPLAELRALCPQRPLAPYEARRVAELQANRLLALQRIDSEPVPEQIIEYLPRVEVAWRKDAPVSGHVEWIGSRWLIAVCSREAWVRQRFTMAHELHHAVSAPLAATIFPARRSLTAHDQREWAANHFAACLLMPKAWVRRAYFQQGIRDAVRLARHFRVSAVAMRVRLDVLGIEKTKARTA